LLDDPGRLGSAIAALVTADDERTAMACRAAALVDGRGALRVALAIAGELGGPGEDLTLRLAGPDDEAWLLDLQSRPQTRRYARNPAAPDPAEHAAWLKVTLDAPDRILMIAMRRGEAVGMARLDLDAAERRAEVSLAVLPEQQGKGVGAGILRALRTTAPGLALEATVLPGNERSAALFASAGYVRTRHTPWRRIP
ncbi:GNAT family N-acetyltransferase, partial [Nostoc sp. NIES-2111]